MLSAGIVDDVLKLLFPPRCQVCGDLDDGLLCEECLSEVCFISPPHCLYCGIPMYSAGRHEASRQLCGNCRDGRWLSGTRAAGLHLTTLRRAVLRYKFQGRTRLAPLFGRLLADVVADEAARGELPLEACAALVPVPLHPNRRRWRGFNQAELLCESLSERTGIPVWSDVILRVRDTVPQVNISGSERLTNVRGAFEAPSRSKLNAAAVILLDDVMTTGATMEECARVLRKSGVAAVYGLTVTRAAPAWHHRPSEPREAGAAGDRTRQRGGLSGGD